MNTILRRVGLGHVSCEGIAAQSKSSLQVVRGDTAPDNANGILFRWGCTASVANHGVVVNTSKAIHFASDKKRSRLAMQEAGVLVPDTWASNEAIYEGMLPCIVRPATHSQGRHLHYCTTIEQLADAIGFGIGGDGYISRYIPKVREYRVYVVCGRIVAVADKLPDDPTAIGWNHSLGASYQNVRFSDWPLNGCYEAIKAMDVVGLDFGGVDVMEDANGRVYVLEVNSAPSLFSDYRTRLMAQAFDYIVANGKAHIPLGGGNRSGNKRWRDFIHPSVNEEARVATEAA